MTRKLGEILQQEGGLDPSVLARALRLQADSGARFGTILLELGLVAEADLTAAVAAQHGVAVVSAEALEVPLPDGLAVSPAFLQRAQVVVLGADDDTLRVAMADPGDAYTLGALRAATRKHIEPSVALPSAIQSACERLYVASESEPVDSDPAGASLEPAGLDADVQQLKDLAGGAPAIRLLNRLLLDATRASASDIHLQPARRGLQVRFRVDGLLRDVEWVSQTQAPALASRVKVVAGMDIAERRLPQDGRANLAVEGRSLDMRVATMPTVHGEGVVIRLLDQARAPLDFPALGFDGEVLARLEEVLNLPHGIFLVTGPTGSGKSTTLHAALRRLNSGDRKVLTIEDPVEYELDGVEQVQVNADIGLDFPQTLRAMLRFDPDVIMVGEMRDAETARIAVQAALTGHKVLSTLHTNDAPGSITRLLDMGVADYLVGSTVNGVLAQRLIRKLCRDCAERCERPHSVTSAIAREQAGRVPDVAWIAGLEGASAWSLPVGCDSCQGTGYAGRTTIYELLLVDDAFRAVCASLSDPKSVRAAAGHVRMRTLMHSGLAKAAEGVTSVDEVLRVAQAF